MPALDDTSLGIDEAAKRAQELGLIIDQDALEASARFGDALSDVRDSVTALKNRALAPVIEFFADNVLPMITDKVIPAVLELADKIGPHIQKFIEITVEKFAAFVKFAQDRIIPIVKDLWERLTNLVERFREWANRVFPGVRDSFKRLKDPIIELWTNLKEAWTNVKELIDNFRTGESDGKGFERFIDRLVSVFEFLLNVINLVIGAVNKMLDVFRRVTESKAFQALLSGIGSIAGGIGSAVGRARGVVGLASGGIVTKPTLAMVGEGGEPEAVIPLSKMGAMGGGVNITINTGVGDPEAIARDIRRILNDSTRRSGTLVAA
jgi:phage-related protein